MSKQDRRSHPYLRVWVADIVQSCQEMTPRQFGAHVRMLLHAWDRGYCPADAGKLRSITGDVPEEEMLDVLDRWRIGDLEGVRGKVYTNERLERERKVMVEQAASRSAAARRANEVRWGSESDPSRIRHGSQTDPIPDSRLQTLDSNTPETNVSCSERKRSKPTIAWDSISRWQGITDQDRTDWAETYPATDIDHELRKMTQWLLANPRRARKSNWRKFIVDWLSRSQDRGGSTRSAKVRERPPHVPEDCAESEWSQWFMPDGRTPRKLPMYTTTDGRRRWLDGKYVTD